MTGLPRPGTGVADMCKEGDQHLEAGELGRATALYTTAFRTHAGSTVSHMRSLDRLRLSGVISTLEDWLDGRGDAQASMEGLNKGLAAVFLSTLSPNNLSASLFKMESVLKSASQGCEEIFARCSTLLEGKRNPRPAGATRVVLELTRALACLLSHPHNPKGLTLYLKAFRENKSETVRQVTSRQAQHLPKILTAFSEQISHKHMLLTPEVKTGNGIKEVVGFDPADTSDFLEFLTEVLPGDSRVQELRAAQFFSTGRFEESADVFSAILNGPHQPSRVQSSTAAQGKAGQGLPPERRASLLTSRAAALFSAGGRAAEVCRDLGETFEVHPATARMVFQRLFVDQGTGAAVRVQLRQQAERGLSGYRENVMARPDLRSTEGVELLDPVVAQLRALCHLESDGGARELRVRLADCLLLRGEHKEALSICSQLASAGPSQQSYQNTVQVLRGYARLLSDDHRGALEDFQAVIEHNAPHPSSCVRALCGRGLLRMTGGLHFLTALDYATSCHIDILTTKNLDQEE
ncbi:uncharacterized protein ttc34 [Osmerus eperlanus]|uniref:uncharacterized protein ttc34 n=1 Tax=Osmerus eperlanus TaxID=29151 RepID=UPI002E14CC21